MRITGGKFKNQRLQVPPTPTVRPTTDMVRQAIFNVLASYGGTNNLQGKQVADVFAGSGALGLEALSRGADHCFFIEKSQLVAKTLQQNIHKLSVQNQATIFIKDTVNGLFNLSPCDILFMDAPYYSQLAAQVLQRFQDNQWLNPHSQVIIELSANEDWHTTSGFKLSFERNYGNTKIIILTFG